MPNDAVLFKSDGLPLPERRQVTALSYDLVGSTQLASRLDPEDLRAIRRSFHDACSNAVKRYEGHINGYAGDGAMAFFGYPGAHEDDAERAVKAGLEIVAGCQELNAKLSLEGCEVAVRVGIATGLVVAGGFNGEPAAGYDDIVGLAPNLANKIQSAAEINTVVISAATHDLVGSLFNLKSQPPVNLKEFPDPLSVWQVRKIRQFPTRYQAGRHLITTPLVSREEELATIGRRWSAAKKGEGQVVLFSGEPGIGKSRLLIATISQLAVPKHAALVFQCSSQSRDTPLQPAIDFLRRITRVTPSQSVADVADRLSRFVPGWSEKLDWTIPYIALLLLPSERSSLHLEDLSSEVIKERSLSAILTLITTISSFHPIILAVEDAHWIDPTSQELLDRLVEQAQELAMLIVVTYRPGYQARWIGQPHVSLLALNRLNSRNSAKIVKHLADGLDLPETVVEQIVKMADGIPLFIEELSQTVLKREQKPAGAVAQTAQTNFDIPASLSDSLTARLDQLGPKREIAQIASAIGRSFPLSLLTKVAATTTVEVEEALDTLLAHGLASVHGSAGGPTYTFKHALIQESAYASMMRNTRQRIHQRIAEILERDFIDSGEATPEVLAHHYGESGQLDKAIANFKEAGRRAAAKSANVEAVNLLMRALGLTAKLPEDGARDELELSLLVALGPLQISTSGPGGPETQSSYKKATELCERLSHSPHHFPALWGWWRVAPNFKEMHQRANRISTHVAVLEDAHLQLQAHHCQWATLFMLGNQKACCDHIAQGLQIYEEGDYRSHGILYGGHDPKVCGLGEKGLSLWLLGYPDQSLRAAASSLEFAESLQHSGTIGHSRDIEIMVHRYRRDAATVLERADAMTAFAQKSGSLDLSAKAKIFRGWALTLQGKVDEGIRLIQDGLEAQRLVGTQEDFPVYYEMLAEAYGIAGKPELGLELIDEAIGMADKTGLQYWTAELLRRKGELLLQQTDRAGELAELCFQKATDVATAQDAKSLLLRIAMSRVRHGEPEANARGHAASLRKVYQLFSEGFDTEDVRQAGKLLQEME
jgi:class 3 adenylate cyclase/predicted ATPase